MPSTPKKKSSKKQLNPTQIRPASITTTNTDEDIQDVREWGSALVVTSRAGNQQNSTICSCCGKKGHAKAECFHKDKCEVCGKVGHLKAVCRHNAKPMTVPKNPERLEGLAREGGSDSWICMECGEVEEFVDEEIERRQKEIATKKGFTLKNHSLALYGSCNKPDCAHKSEK